MNTGKQTEHFHRYPKEKASSCTRYMRAAYIGNSPKLQAIGSITLIRYKRRHFLVTATHVIDAFKKAKRNITVLLKPRNIHKGCTGLSIDPNSFGHILSNEEICGDSRNHVYDIAFMEVGKNTAKSFNLHDFYTLENTRTLSERKEHIACICGIIANKNKRLDLQRSIKTNTTLLWVSGTKDNLILLHHPKTNTHNGTARSSLVGMSGGPAFELADLDELEVNDGFKRPSLIGITTGRPIGGDSTHIAVTPFSLIKSFLIRPSQQ